MRRCHAGSSATSLWPPLLPKEKPGFWTRGRAFEQVRRGFIQLLSYSLVADGWPSTALTRSSTVWAGQARRGFWHRRVIYPVLRRVLQQLGEQGGGAGGAVGLDRAVVDRAAELSGDRVGDRLRGR